MFKAHKILKGPSWEDVLKSLCTFGVNKYQVEFELEGRSIKGAIYNVWDMGDFVEDAKSHEYTAMFSWSSFDGQPDHGMATVVYYMETAQWGTFTQAPDIAD